MCFSRLLNPNLILNNLVSEKMTVAKGEYFEFSRISGSHVELHPIELWRRNYKNKTKEEVFVAFI